jgi:hypothetical protein
MGRADTDVIAGDAFFIGADAGNATDAGGTSAKLVIDSSGNVGIACTNPDDGNLQIGDANSAFNIAIAGPRAKFGFDGSNAIVQGGTSKGIAFCVNNTTLASGEAMRIDSSGKVGIGTTSPSEELELASSSPTIRLTDTDDSTYGSISYNVNALLLNGDNTIRCYTGDTERMRIDSSGKVGVGITSPTANLHVRATTDGTEANAHFKIEGAVSTYIAHHWLDSNAYYIGQNSSFRALRIYSGAESSGVNLSSGGTSWGTFSDERLKYDVEPVENAVESLSNLRTVKYRLKDVDSAEDKKKIGLMAQDLVGVLDEVIDPIKKTGDDTEYMSVRYTELVPVLVKAIQEQQTLIESLTARIAALEE